MPETNIDEFELKTVAHIVSRTSDSATARLVLRDSHGFYRAVLCVGDPASNEHNAVEGVIRKYEAQLRAYSEFFKAVR